MNTINETALTASSVIAALNQFDESTYAAIIKHIKGIRAERKTETARQISELEAKLKALKKSSPQGKTYGSLGNPNNPNEVYTTGQYKPWLIDWAKTEGVDTYDTKAMAEWVKMKKSQ